ncbi:sodium-dependent bicarbonate transport family permease [Prochlorococcus marinus]|uniref:sodium-dependent bicarbonate transport family permease n=1 Tax=Prochlorococcus marinus TaxID=1219 RepID=UPI0022B56057|nr:sodium-dependent bicarbonate transport family permease [Prochlorococcus marinus]
METNLVLQNVLTPPVLFFFLGIVAVVLRSDLEIPAPLPKLFSLYLLLAIGFKGGMELESSGLGGQVLPTVGSAIIMSLVIPLICFVILRLKLDVFNSAAIAAAYGSISAVTFITAESFLESQNIPFDGFMVAALALMESPAIIVGLILVKIAGTKNRRPDSRPMKWRTILRESVLNGSVYLLLGSLLIGFLTAAHNPSGVEKMQPFTGKLFYGAECFFLLDMGIVAAQRLPGLRKAGSFLIFFAVLIPLFNALLGIAVAKALVLGPGNALLFAVLCASASYLAVPAAMRMTVPEAKASYYISTTLGLTFPFNIVIGIPLYMGLVNTFIPS